MPSPTWAGTHCATKISTNLDDYVFFLSKDEAPHGCFSNAYRYRENNGHHASSSSSSPSASKAADGDVTSPCPTNPSFWCVNQELHYRKSLLFKDHDIARQILAEQNDANKIKALGRMVRDYDDAVWCEARYDICLNALHAKFSQNPELKRILLETGTKVIVEAAKDKVWGIGHVEFTTSSENGIDGRVLLGAKNKETGGWDVEPKDWMGGNLLGRCLMDVRKSLASAS
mmetsp:Transcript_13505/g.24170  ORF Transcript_13505/g.24170 Transcript_13505/m.24170 type:complete len:229 (+) Transcript_13505:68-754(+)